MHGYSKIILVELLVVEVVVMLVVVVVVRVIMKHFSSLQYCLSSRPHNNTIPIAILAICNLLKNKTKQKLCK
jgi:hypothetical protein